MKKQVGVAYPPDHGWMLPNSETLNVGSLYEDGNVYLFTLPPGSSMAAAFIVGTTWSLNHGTGMIVQSEGGAWIDMAFAAASGLLVASVVRGGSASKAMPNLLAALVGGILGGLALSFYL